MGIGSSRERMFENFDLRVRYPESGLYPVEVTASPSGEMRQAVKQECPLADDEFLDLLEYLADLLATPDEVKQLGQRMREFLFPGLVWEQFYASRLNMKASGKGLRIRLRVDPPELSRLPWEYCYDDRFSFFALQRETPMVRYVAEPFPPGKLTAPRPLKILLVTASPSDLQEIDVDREEERVRGALGELEAKGQVDLKVLHKATPQGLLQCLMDDPHVLHFVGHGSFESGQGSLAFQNEEGKTHPVDAEQLMILLSDSGVKAVMLTSCETAAHGTSEAIMGVAPALVRGEIPAVIAMQFELPFETARKLNQVFYQSLAKGIPLDAAMTEMRIGAFVSTQDKVFWGIPVLFMRAKNGVIWQPADVRDPSLLSIYQKVTKPAQPGAQYGDSVGQGLLALAELIRSSSEVRSNVGTFRSSFKTACEHINRLADYKALHDQLHKLQFNCFNLLIGEQRRFPDEAGVDLLDEYEYILQTIIDDSKDIAERASFGATDTSWIQDLIRAHEALVGAIGNLDAKLLKDTIWCIKRVLTQYPMHINTRLNTEAQALKLPNLVESMAYVSGKLARLNLDPEKVSQFETGLEALVNLSQSLTHLRDDHSRWQDVDVKIGLMENDRSQGIEELESSWLALKDKAEQLYIGKDDRWATSLRKYGDSLDSAFATSRPGKVGRFIKRYRREVGERFHNVDDDLKDLCEDLRKIGGPLAALMEAAE